MAIFILQSWSHFDQKLDSGSTASISPDQIYRETIIREWKYDDKVICTYHIKTLMLWACERESPVWWEYNCVLVLCSKLLGTLVEWIEKKMCPHYFIPEWNLFDYTMKESRRLDTIEMLRIHINIRAISEWFRINYLSKVFGKKIVLVHFLIRKKKTRVKCQGCIKFIQ